MKINGYGEVASIRFKHIGCEQNFELILPIVYQEGVSVQPSTIAFLEFKDTFEIDSMIHLLTKFRDECKNGMGRWHRT